MERMNFDYPIAFKGYDTEYINEILDEKDRIIDTQGKDLMSLKREIVELKKQISYSNRKKK